MRGTGLITVAVTATHGALSLAAARQLVPAPVLHTPHAPDAAALGAVGAGGLVFSATVADANRALSVLRYRPSDGYVGGDAIKVTCSDGGNWGTGGVLVGVGELEVDVMASATGSLAWHVSGLDGGGTEVTMVEDQTSHLASGSAAATHGEGGAGARISISEGSGSADPTQRLTVTIQAARAVPSVVPTAALEAEVAIANTTATTTLVLDGPRAALNTALASLALTPEPDVWGFDQMSLVVDDGVDTAATSLLLSITAVNDAPTWSTKVEGVDVDGLELHGWVAGEVGGWGVGGGGWWAVVVQC